MNDEIVKSSEEGVGENTPETHSRRLTKTPGVPEPFNLARLRPYQQEVFDDDQTGILVMHWGRQLGKSFTLASWAVKRLLDYPGRLVTVLSNSRENGAEFLLKCSEICGRVSRKLPSMLESGSGNLEDYRMELRLPVKHKVSRIKVLAANPRTARGFSGDLILDEFAFHENSAAIWEAAEPILSSNPNFLCRVASTGNGRHNMFFRMVHGSSLADETGASENQPSSLFKVSRMTRSRAHELGVLIYHPRTRKPITPAEAREAAMDKRAYDQNYECSFADENLAMLTHELICAAERDDVGDICEQDWTGAALERLRACQGRLFAGFDVGRKVDLSVITVLEKRGSTFYVRAILRMRDLRLPEQEQRLGALCKLRHFDRVAIDMTGLGLGMVEYAQRSFGSSRIRGVNFATSVPIRGALPEGQVRPNVRITEAMATELLRVYEDRRIEHPRDEQLRADLRKPEKVTSPGGRVSIAATRDEAGHADHFWSLALALHAAGGASTRPTGGMEVFKLPPSFDMYTSTRHITYL